MSFRATLLIKWGRTGGENLGIANPQVTHQTFKKQSGDKTENFLKKCNYLAVLI